MTPEALAHLKKVCPIMRQLIETHGSCTLSAEGQRSPFESLVRAVSHQQLHGKAAETILGRFLDLFPGKAFPEPEDLGSLSDEQIRAVGFSGSKVRAIRDIAAKALDGTIPTSRAIKLLSDEEIIARLTQVRGVGRWTAEMLLIFKLGRPDVFPADDYGVRNGFRLVTGEEELPKPKVLRQYAERWRPYTTTAAWYLWRAADAAKEAGPIKGVNS